MTLDDLNTKSAELALALKRAWSHVSADGDPNFRWTGWKGSDSSSGYCAQWLDWYQFGITPRIVRPQGYYVNLPGMQRGWYVAGGEFEVGQERVTLSTSWAEVEQLIRAGYKLLMEKPQ